MEVRASNSSLTSAKTDLAIKVAILGKLERKQQQEGTLKIKDFDEIIHDLNFSKDSNSIKSMLKNCNVDNKSYLDLQSLKDSINIERAVYNAKNMKKINQNNSNSNNVKELNNTTNNPNIQDFNSSKQIKTVEDKRKQVQTIYNMLSKHEIDTETASYLLSLHSIHPTKQFMKLAENMNLTEVKLVDFTRSLTTGEPALEQSIDPINLTSSSYTISIAAAASRSITPMVIAAGSMTRTAIDKFEESMQPSMHHKPSNVLTIGEEIVEYRTNRKMSNDKHFNAGEIKDTLQHQPFTKGKRNNKNNNNNSSTFPSSGISTMTIDNDYIKTKKILMQTRSLNDHGDCIAWRQPPTKIEIKDDSHVKFRKGTFKMSNLATDVIIWEKHHDRSAKAPESAYWDEFKKDGGFRISKGAKNISSQCDILTFDPQGTSTTTARSLRRSMSAGGNNKNNNSYTIIAPTTTVTTIQRSPYQLLFNQEEKVLAGSPSKTISNIPFFTDYRTRKILSHQSMHHNTKSNNNNNNNNNNTSSTSISNNTGKPYDVESSVPTTHLIFSKEANCLVHGDASQARTIRKHGYNNQATIHRNPITG